METNHILARAPWLLAVIAVATWQYGTVTAGPALSTDVFTSPCPFLDDPTPLSPPSPSPPPPSPPPPSPPPALSPPFPYQLDLPGGGTCTCTAPPPTPENSTLLYRALPPLGPRTNSLPDTTGFQLWSSPSTWPSGIVPGLPGISDWANATVPCGRLLLLDVPAVNLALLQIKGFLKVLDHPSLPSISVKAHFIVVEGQLSVGTPERQFSQKITFELTPNRNNRANYGFTSFLPAEPLFPRNLGHKVFAVVGGQVRLHGLTGPQNTPSWVKLGRTANQGEASIYVTSNVVGSWPVGAKIVISSTDYDRKQAEVFTITGVFQNKTGSLITLDSPLNFMHYGEPNSLSNGFGGFIDQCAEVALLTRNIVITGTDEPEPYLLEGGHFMVFMTQTPQFIEGVEFVKMGQQGTLGRYNIHFHVVGSTPGTVCRKNVLRDSKQRCVVIHGSHNITVDSNVAYNTSGHCFMTEEGGEEDNTFINNLGILTNPVVKLIPNPTTNMMMDETDIKPSTFWIANPKNNYINNVAAGSQANGFWFELRTAVRGMSLTLPVINVTNPNNRPFGQFTGNVAHSNDGVGIRTYPFGTRPRLPNNMGTGPTSVLDKLTVYKNVQMGMFVHNTENFVVTNSAFSDNGFGIYLNQDLTVVIKDTSFTALSTNYGNPRECWRNDPMTPCRPITGCTMPLPWGAQGRSTGIVPRYAQTFGVLVDQSRDFDGPLPNTIQNVTFNNYDETCRTASSIATIGTGDFWNPAHSISGLKFSANSNTVWTPPQIYQIYPWGQVNDGGEQSQFYTLRDLDGSVVGSPGYIVVNNSKILPPNASGCTPTPSLNMFKCPGVCYRSIRIIYPEPGFTMTEANVNFTRGNFSSLQITRVSDGQVMILDGNLKKTSSMSPNSRDYSAVLLGNQTYQITFVPPRSASSFFPMQFTLSYREVGGCGSGVTLQFPRTDSNRWAVPSSSNVFYSQCPGTAVLSNTTSNAQYSYVCNAATQTSVLEVVLAHVFKESATIIGIPGPAPCVKTSQCSFIWGGARWQYEESGRELRPFFYNPRTDTSSWSQGFAPLGIVGWMDPFLKTRLLTSSLPAYYFRQTFTLVNSACYTTLQIETIVDDGILLYLNNKEILRSNMPNGTISNTTVAIMGLPYGAYTNFTIPLTAISSYLVEGVNTLAAEVHTFAPWAGALSFDLRLSGIRNVSCTGAVSSPEICDGIDNDGNGQVDDGVDGKLLTRPCQTACGSGLETCPIGVFQQCTAPPVNTEICNLIDDNCDGLVDNGFDQLNCPNNTVCSKGQCLPFINATTPVMAWPRNTTGWAYYDMGGNMDVLNPQWRLGNVSSAWPTGRGPLGFNVDNQTWDTFGTTLQQYTNKNVTSYFFKSFTLNQTEVNTTYSVDFNIRRVDGAVVYLNGKELWRPQMPWSNITYTTVAISSTGTWSTTNAPWMYDRCTACLRNTSSALQVGVNWIAVELHASSLWRRNVAFDMDLNRSVVVSCSDIPGSPTACVRQINQTISPANAEWEYNDGSLPLPSLDWMLPSFNSSSWKIGAVPMATDNFGLRKTTLSRGTVTRRTYYFRKTIQVPEASCYFLVTSVLAAIDAGAVYINGLEAYRTSNMPAGPLNSTSFAVRGGGSYFGAPTSLAGGWLKPGPNLFAAEVHQTSGNNVTVVFDWQLIGTREALGCTPLPP